MKNYNLVIQGRGKTGASYKITFIIYSIIYISKLFNLLY